MPYYKDTNDRLHFLDSVEFEHFLPPGCTQINEAEASAMPLPTESDIIAALTHDVQSHMDTAARSAGYDDIKSAVTYADEPAVPRFQAEGQAFRAWRSLCWSACYAIMADVQSGARSIPTATELIAELPALELPA